MLYCIHCPTYCQALDKYCKLTFLHHLVLYLTIPIKEPLPTHQWP